MILLPRVRLVILLVLTRRRGMSRPLRKGRQQERCAQRSCQPELCDPAHRTTAPSKLLDLISVIRIVENTQLIQ